MGEGLRDWNTIFVGCGGTFYAALSLIAQWLYKWTPGRVMLCDPDILEARNFHRQWAMASREDSKAGMACRVLRTFGPVPHACRFSELTGINSVRRSLEIAPTLLVVNTDNNESRLECRNWCKALAERHSTGMVVTGCDAEKGQAYSGLWTPMGDVHDWLEAHSDVEDTSEDGTNPPCGGQTLESNALTAICMGRALENFCLHVTAGQRLREYYWSKMDQEGRTFLYERAVA